jgi:hypothetical protein
MKRFLLNFLRRGTVAAGIGPIVLAAVYLILGVSGTLPSLTPIQAAVGILSLAVLAFIAGGLNALYAIERLPLMLAILIHGGALYLAYLGTYLVNGWLEEGALPIIIFSAIFAAGYFVIWAAVYVIVKRSTARINRALAQKQKSNFEK